MSFPTSAGWAILVDLAFLTGYVALLTLNQRMVTEINRTLPEVSRLNYWRMWPWETVKIYVQHKRLFPHSKVRSAAHITGVIWFPFLIMFIFRIRQAINATM